MKIFVKSLKGNHFQIEVEPHHTVSDVKKNIESVQGANVFPASEQMIIYQGKALTDGTTLEENKVAENSFIVVMLCKSKNSSWESSGAAAVMPTSKSKSLSGESSVAAAAMPTPKNTGESSVIAAAMPLSKLRTLPGLCSCNNNKTSLRESQVAETAMPISNSNSSPGECPVVAAAAAAMPMSRSKSNSSSGESSLAADAVCSSKAPSTIESLSADASTTPPSNVTNASVPAHMPTSVPVPSNASSVSETDVGCQVASNLVVGNGLENIIQHIVDMGGGIWDRDTVVYALRAASNDPERAVEFLYTGVPEQAEAGQSGQPTNGSAVSLLPTPLATLPSSTPDAGPLNIFPRGLPNMGSDSGPLDFLRHSEQFQALRSMVQANPHTLQPMLQELGKQNPNLMRLIQEHQSDFQRLLNEPVQGEERNILEQFAGAVPQAIQVTPTEHTSIERLEAMGFDRSTVLEAYFACDKNEELTANYLLDHMHEF